MNTLDLPGATLAYHVVGRGPAVVLVHGFGLDSRMWEPLVDALAAHHRVVRYDCRGFGASGPMDPNTPYTHAGDLLALLDHLAIPQASIVGMSFGGRVALQTALAAPDRVTALVLLDAVLDGVPWDAESIAGLATLDRAVAADGVPGGRRAWLAHPLFAQARSRPDLAQALTTMVEDYPGQHWLGQDPHIRVPRVIDHLEAVVQATLVVVGELDVPCFRTMAGILAARIPQAQLETVEGSGHMASMEQPTLITRLIAEHVAVSAPPVSPRSAC